MKECKICKCGHLEKEHHLEGPEGHCVLACECKKFDPILGPPGAARKQYDLQTHQKACAILASHGGCECLRYESALEIAIESGPRPDEHQGLMEQYQAMVAKAEGRPSVPQGAPQELKNSLLEQLRHVLDKPFSPRMLKELTQTADLSRQMLAVAGDPDAKGRRKRRGVTLGVQDSWGNSYSDIDAEFEGDIAPPAETFGAASIRELVTALRDQNKPDVVQLTRALKLAKEEGLEDVVEHIRGQLKEITSDVDLAGPEILKDLDKPDE